MLPCQFMNIVQCLAILLILSAGNLNATTLQGKDVDVFDGDTVTILDPNNSQHKIRLQGINEPYKAEAFGQRSKQSLHQLIHSKQVSIEFHKKDK